MGDQATEKPAFVCPLNVDMHLRLAVFHILTVRSPAPDARSRLPSCAHATEYTAVGWPLSVIMMQWPAPVSQILIV